MKFTQNEIEAAISDIIPNGVRKQIAAITQIYPSVIYGMLNPDDERKSFQFGTLQVQCALDQVDGQIGDKHWLTMCQYRELSKPRKLQNLSLMVETGKLASETADVVAAHCSGKPLEEQHREALQAKAQAERTLKAIEEAMEKEAIYQQTFSALNGNH